MVLVKVYGLLKSGRDDDEGTFSEELPLDATVFMLFAKLRVRGEPHF
jgi:hypothetical protein